MEAAANGTALALSLVANILRIRRIHRSLVVLDRRFNLARTQRVWIEILALGAAIACVIALLIATLGAAAGAAVDGLGARQESPATTEREYEGMITCSRCGARHSANLGQTADICVRICVHGGANFALVNAESSYLLEGDLGALKKLAGQRARVVGNLSGKTIHVASVAAQS